MQAKKYITKKLFCWIFGPYYIRIQNCNVNVTLIKILPCFE